MFGRHRAVNRPANLLDHHVAEFAFSLPAQLKVDFTENKPVLVGAVHDLLPDSVATRRKVGFELPLREWIVGPLKDRSVSSYSSKMARTIFSKPFIDRTLCDIDQCQKASYRVWAYMILIEWLELHRCEL